MQAGLWGRLQNLSLKKFKILISNKICVSNDPLGQTHSFASSDHHFHLKFFVLRDFDKCD